MNAAPSASIESASAAAWPRVKLGEVCEFRRGLAYPKSAEVEKSSTVVLRSNNVDLANNSLDLRELRYISDSTEVPSEKRVVPGALLICLANGSKNHLGKVALIDQDYGYAFGGFMGLIVPNESIDSRYLYFCMASPQFKTLVHFLTDGANINNLRFGDIAKFPLPLPPLSVQREIVARLDAELAKADRMREEFLAIAENAAARFRAILAEIFEGGEAGDSWLRKKLGEECEFRRGLAYPKSAEVEKSSTVVLRSNNVDLASNSLDLQELRYISDSTEVPSEKRVVPGALLICLANGSKNHLGKVALIDQDYGYAFGGFMGLIVPKESIDSRYLYFCLASSQFKALVKSLTDGANINNLKFGDISEFSIPLPPLSVQREIVCRLDAARAECDRAEALARKGAEECAGLRAALLKEAFE